MRGTSRSRNISEGGIRLFIFEELRSGVILKLWIELEDLTKPIIAIGKIVWSGKKAEKEAAFEVGIKFIKIEPADCDRLRDYILKLSKQKKPKGIKISWLK